MNRPAFVEVGGYPVGRGDFVIKLFGSRGTQLARVHHWVNANRARGFVYQKNSGRWSKLVTIELNTIISKVTQLGGLSATLIVGAPKIEA